MSEIKILLEGVSVAAANDSANSTFIDVIGNKLDASAATGSIVGRLKYIADNLSTDTDVAALIGALNTASHGGAVDDVTTIVGYIKQLVTALNTVKADLDNGGRLDLLLDAIKTVTDMLPNGGALTSLATAANLAITDGKVDTVVTAVGTTIPNILTGVTANTAAVKREAGRTQVKVVPISSAANAGLITLGTVTTQSCLIKSIVLRAASTGQVDLTSAAVKGGGATGETVVFISDATAIKTAIDTMDEQVSYVGRTVLPATGLITVDLQGTGVTAVGLEAVIEYSSLVDGGYIA